VKAFSSFLGQHANISIQLKKENLELVEVDRNKIQQVFKQSFVECD